MGQQFTHGLLTLTVLAIEKAANFHRIDVAVPRDLPCFGLFPSQPQVEERLRIIETEGALDLSQRRHLLFNPFDS